MTTGFHQKVTSHEEHGVSTKKSADAASRVQEILRDNRQSAKGGTYAVCSAHPAVIEASIQRSREDGSLLHIESTSSQVNQFGGYTGNSPAQFAQWIYSAANNAGLASEQVLLGGDHLGPFPWRNEQSISALEKACKLVRDCVTVGYQKIHLDASMACADDPKTGLAEQTIAARAAILCQAAEQAHRELPPGSPQPLYVVGTEVPVPGGETNDTGAPTVTKANDVHRTLEAFQSAFEELRLESAWERVIALVVQPGVDFGSNSIFDYERGKAASLSAALDAHPGLVFEAHSTDYQPPHALAQLVEDHFAILKVGPWLTFAYREAVLAVSAIERELFGAKAGIRLSQVREVLDQEMLRDPSQWRSYYHGVEDEIRRDRIYSYSDRCRYYWNQPPVKEEVDRLLDNLRPTEIPLTLISQYLPLEYEIVRAGELPAVAERMIEHHIGRVLRVYGDACTVSRPLTRT
jgi:D-tagatose-1,6-bisphosphate aldolase subunit GatZ/KbaZ